jgi:hypothetical protein
LGLNGAVTIRAGTPTPGVPGQLDEAVENTEFEFELDAVYEWLPRGLDLKHICKFEAQDAEVKEDDKEVDEHEMVK